MAKRLTDSDKWTKNKWFRKLPSKYKLFWLFILDHCDPVGVWEEDIEFAGMMINEEYTEEEILKQLGDRIKKIKNGKKWWIVDFCNFQYGELKEENISNRPHQSYITLLKKHSLWIDYKNSLQRDKEKDIDKEKEKEKEKDKDKDKDKIPYEIIINDLNQKAGRTYRYTTKKTRDLIKARFKEGFTAEDFFKVHTIKTTKWKGDPKWDIYLRPETLYSAIHFESYLNEKIFLSDNGKVSQQTEKTMQRLNKWLESHGET